MTLNEQIAAAVEELGAIPFFPKESGAQFAIMRAMEKFVRGERELHWLIDTAVAKMREWKGVAELRGLYCTRFSPLDGVEEDCSTPGFTPADCEQQNMLAAAGPKYLPAPDDQPITDDERRAIAELAEKIKMRATSRGLQPLKPNRPAWLENLS